MIFDTHCHIYDEAYGENEQEEIIQRAIDNGVRLFLVPSDNIINSYKSLKIADSHKNIYSAVGVHPSEIYTLNLEESLKTLEDMSEDSKVKAIGEIGLDYFWHKDKSQQDLQKVWFIAQIELANKLHLPIIVHSRDAALDTITILKEHKPLYGCVYHCYSYSVEMLREILSLGFYIGLDGPVTFKNSVTPKEVAKSVPCDRLFVETDCPYLTPAPNRGKRNEPSYVTYTLGTIAQLKGMTYDELAKITFENGCRFFGITYEE